MGSAKTTRKAQPGGSRKDNASDNSTVMKTRKAHQIKDVLTKDAVKNATTKAKETRATISKTRSQNGKPIAQNGRQPGRQLIRWNATTDQLLLLTMEYELKKNGIAVPYDEIAKRLASEKDTTGACVQQHLAKLRKELLGRGCWVPPLAGKPGARQGTSDVRGLVMVTGKGGERELKELGWNEDAFKYVDMVHNSQYKISKRTVVSESTGISANFAKTKKSSPGVPDEEDPADLPSEDEFNPAYKKPNQIQRITRSAAKSAPQFNKKFDEFEYESENESNSDDIDVESGRPVMMALYESEEEEEEFDGKVVLDLPEYLAVRFPRGVSGNARAIAIGDTNSEGGSVSYDDETESYAHAHVKGTPNSSAAMMEDQDDSIMAANTLENYLAAFPGTFDAEQQYMMGDPEHYMMDDPGHHMIDDPGHYMIDDPEYSIMDANTHENYMAAFGDGFDHGVHGNNASYNFQNGGDSPESTHVVGYSGPPPHDDMFGPSFHGVSDENETGYMEEVPADVLRLYEDFRARAASRRASGQNAGGAGNTALFVFPSGTRVSDIVNAARSTRDSTGNSAGNTVDSSNASFMDNSFDIRYEVGEGSGDVANNNISSTEPASLAEEYLDQLEEERSLEDYVRYRDEQNFIAEEYATFRDEYDYGPLFESDN